MLPVSCKSEIVSVDSSTVTVLTFILSSVTVITSYTGIPGVPVISAYPGIVLLAESCFDAQPPHSR